jgi:hypothetical protein
MFAAISPSNNSLYTSEMQSADGASPHFLNMHPLFLFLFIFAPPLELAPRPRPRTDAPFDTLMQEAAASAPSEDMSDALAGESSMFSPGPSWTLPLHSPSNTAALDLSLTELVLSGDSLAGANVGSMKHSAVGASDVTGGIIGGLAVLAGAGVVFYFIRRQKRETEEEEERATDLTFQAEPLLLDEIEGENPPTLASAAVNNDLEPEVDASK